MSDCLDEVFCALAYPTFIVVCFAVWYSLSRCEEHPRATGRWWFRCI